jgi:hypothetical protein
MHLPRPLGVCANEFQSRRERGPSFVPRTSPAGGWREPQGTRGQPSRLAAASAKAPDHHLVIVPGTQATNPRCWSKVVIGGQMVVSMMVISALLLVSSDHQAASDDAPWCCYSGPAERWVATPCYPSTAGSRRSRHRRRLDRFAHLIEQNLRRGSSTRKKRSHSPQAAVGIRSVI